MEIQELMVTVSDKIQEVNNIEASAELRAATMEDIRDRANDIGSSLQHYMDNLTDLEQTLIEAFAVIEDADLEELEY